MLSVTVPTKRPTSREALDEMVERLDSIFNDIRRKAFDCFLSRGQAFGSELEDWFKAERELFAIPESEMTETGEQFQIRAAVPGFPVEALHIEVLPELIVIEGKVQPKDEGKGEKTEAQLKPTDDKVVFTDFASKRMFRQYKLAVPVKVEDVTARLDTGILTITAPKAAPVEAPKALEVPIHAEVIKATPTAMVAAASK